jgi:hypothetical protein
MHDLPIDHQDELEAKDLIHYAAQFRLDEEPIHSSASDSRGGRRPSYRLEFRRFGSTDSGSEFPRRQHADTTASTTRPNLGSAFDADSLAFGISDRLLECVYEELITISSFPGLLQSRRRQIEVRSNLLKDRPQIHM